MDKRTAKMIAAERIRRQIARAADAEDRRAAYYKGREAGQRMRVEPMQIPSPIIEQVLRDMSRLFAREAIDKFGHKLPIPVVGRVAEQVWDRISKSGAGLADGFGEMLIEQEAETGNFRVDVTIPAMRLCHMLDRRHVQMGGM